MPGIPHSYHVSFNNGPENVVTVSTENHRDAAVAAIAILGIEPTYPMEVEIRLSQQKVRDEPRFYLIEEDQIGRLVVAKLLR